MHRNAGPLVSSFPAIQLRANTYIEGNVAKRYEYTLREIIPLEFFIFETY